MAHVPDYIYSPTFLKFVEAFYKKFRAQNGYGRWLHEYQEMEAKGLFKPTIIRALYVKLLTNKFYLGYIKSTAIRYIGVYAADATKAYIESTSGRLYKICVITGETAVDDDGDEYIELSFDEANQICKLLNDEAEELLFKVTRM